MINVNPPGRVQVTAHRGSSRDAPENSLSAIRRAIEDGADYAEIDVQETADGVVVVIHDSDLRRIAGLHKNLWEVSYEQIKDLDAGSWFSPAFRGEPIATLQQVIAVARGRIKLNIELKFNGHEQRLPERVVRIIEDNRFESQCVVTSFSYAGLQRIRRLNARLRIGYILAEPVGDISQLEVDFLSLEATLAQKKLLCLARERGLGVHVWTVNDSRIMAAMIDRGVENIITDQPKVLISMLKERLPLMGKTEGYR